MTLKEVAEQLGINYSTAKTIVQTFRKERRVAKKLKRIMTTKKATAKENLLVRYLTRYRVKNLLTAIIDSELGLKKKEECLQKNILEISTVGVSLQTNNARLTPMKILSRIESAGDMLLFRLEEEGPYDGQISRGVSANMNFAAQKRPIFFILTETNIEEECKDKIDYNNLVLLKNKHMSEIGEPLVMETEKVQEKDNIIFDFHEYKKCIAANEENMRGSQMQIVIEERILPTPKIRNYIKK